MSDLKCVALNISVNIIFKRHFYPSVSSYQCVLNPNVEEPYKNHFSLAEESRKSIAHLLKRMGIIEIRYLFSVCEFSGKRQRIM